MFFLSINFWGHHFKACGSSSYFSGPQATIGEHEMYYSWMCMSKKMTPPCTAHTINYALYYLIWALSVVYNCIDSTEISHFNYITYHLAKSTLCEIISVWKLSCEKLGINLLITFSINHLVYEILKMAFTVSLQPWFSLTKGRSMFARYRFLFRVGKGEGTEEV